MMAVREMDGVLVAVMDRLSARLQATCGVHYLHLMIAAGFLSISIPALSIDLSFQLSDRLRVALLIAYGAMMVFAAVRLWMPYLRYLNGWDRKSAAFFAGIAIGHRTNMFYLRAGMALLLIAMLLNSFIANAGRTVSDHVAGLAFNFFDVAPLLGYLYFICSVPADPPSVRKLPAGQTELSLERVRR